MRILFISNGQGANPEAFSGGDIRLFRHIRHLTQHYPDISVSMVAPEPVCEYQGKLIPQASFIPVKATLSNSRGRSKAGHMFANVISLSDTLRKLKRLPEVDLIIIYSDFFYNVIPAFVFCRKRRIPWVQFIHHKYTPPGKRPGNYFVNAIMYWLQLFSFRLIRKRAEMIFVYDTDEGDSLFSYFTQRAFPRERIRRMANGIDVEYLRELPSKEVSYDAVFVGMRPNKGVFDVIPIWKSLVSSFGLRLKLAMIGGCDNATLDKLRNDAQDAGISDLIDFRGAMDHDKCVKTMKDARFFLAPSHEEGWGIAVCEAMGLGLPVVAYDLGAYNRIYGDSYLKVPCFDMRRFAERIKELMSDPVMYRHYQDMGRDTAAKYDWQTILEKDTESIREMVEKR